MKVVLLRHHQINKAAWDACLQHSDNALAYAHSSWLDAMCPNWQGIVCGDYEAIMPLPVRQKLGVQYVFSPAFTQQLGLFGKSLSTGALLPTCIGVVKNNFRYAELLLNYTNALSTATMRNNLVLDLSRDVREIEAGFTNDLYKNLKRAGKFGLLYKQMEDVGEAIDLYREHYARQMGMHTADFEWFRLLMEQWQKKGWCFVRRVETADGNLLACGVFVLFRKRIYNLASTTLPNGRMMEANHWLFYELLKEFAGKVEWLDFEGSDLPGIARFYQKFGAVAQPYYVEIVNDLPPILRWLKR